MNRVDFSSVCEGPGDYYFSPILWFLRLVLFDFDVIDMGISSLEITFQRYPFSNTIQVQYVFVCVPVYWC